MMVHKRPTVALAALVLAFAFVQVAGVSGAAGPIGTWPRPIYHLDEPEGVATDTSGNVYVADTANSRVVKFGADGGRWVWGGPGTSAGRFDHPSGIAVSPDGDYVYVADTGNHRIQMLTSQGAHLKSWGREGGPDARGSGAKEFDSPKGVCTDSDGHVLVADTGNERIQMFTEQGEFVLKWGEPGSFAGQFYEPTGIAYSPFNNCVYVVDHDRTNANVQQFVLIEDSETVVDEKFVRKIGGPQPAGPFKTPWGIAIDATGNLYVSDQTSLTYLVHKFTSDGEDGADPIASWAVRGYGDGRGSEAYMLGPTGLTMLSNGDEQIVLVCDTRQDRLREFDLAGEALGVRGSWGISPGRFNQASGIAVDAEGNVYVSSRSSDTPLFEQNHRVQKFSASGDLLAWTPDVVPGFATDENGDFDEATAVAVDASGDVYVTEAGNHRVQKLSSSLGYLTKWGELGTYPDRFDSPGGVAIGKVGNQTRVFVADTNNSRIVSFPTSGGWPIDNFGTAGSGSGQLNKPQGLAVSADGNVIYVADTGNHRIQYFVHKTVRNPVTDAEESVWEYAGKWGSFGNDATHFRSPQGVAVTPLGEVLVADTGNDRIKRFDADGTPLGGWGASGSDPGQFLGPRGVAVALDGTVYVADTGNHRVQYFPPDLATAEITVTRSTSVTAYGGAFTTTARLLDADGVVMTGEALNLYKSYDGVTWTYLKSMTSATGDYSYSTKLTRKTYFRWSYEAESGAGGTDALTYANCRAYLSTPSYPNTVRKGAVAFASGYLKPRHASGTEAVTIYAYQKVSGRWILRSKTPVRISNYSSYSRYKSYVTLTRAGRWRIRAVHSDSNHAWSKSYYRYVTVQ